MWEVEQACEGYWGVEQAYEGYALSKGIKTQQRKSGITPEDIAELKAMAKERGYEL